MPPSCPSSVENKLRRRVPVYLKKDHLFNARETLQDLNEGKVPMTRRYRIPKRRKSKRRGRRQRVPRGQAQAAPQGLSRPKSALGFRSKLVQQILRLNRSSCSPAHTTDATEESIVTAAVRAHGIAKAATGLGIVSAREADVAIRRHMMSLGSESPRRTLLRTVFTLTGKAIDESKLIDREPRDTSARGAYDILVLGETVLLPTQPLGRRSRPNRGRASSAAGVIAQATQGCRRLVAYPPDVARLNEKMADLRVRQLEKREDQRLEARVRQQRHQAWLSLLHTAFPIIFLSRRRQSPPLL